MVRFHIIGAGPAGLATALLLGKQGIEVTVYDKLNTLEQSIEDSYPIGLNPRGLAALGRMGDHLRSEMEKESPVDAWCVYVKSRRVVRFGSGTTLGSTRGGVSFALYEECRQYESVEVRLGQEMTAIDFDARKLHMRDVAEDRVYEVDASEDKVIGADGVWSRIRRQWMEEDAEFRNGVVTRPWDMNFRLLLSQHHATTTLNPREHHIFGGAYVAQLSDSTGQWVIVVSNRTSDANHDMLASDEATAERCRQLREHVARVAPMAESLLDDDDIEKYFSRRSFTGAVIQVPKLQRQNWCALIGDAAHAVLPAVGEGINCGLETACVLADAVAADRENCLKLFEEMRLADVRALGEFALYTVEGTTASLGEKISRGIVQLSLQTMQYLSVMGDSWTDQSFGKSSTNLVPYSVMYENWVRQTNLLLPVARAVGNTIGFILSPFTGGSVRQPAADGEQTS